MAKKTSKDAAKNAKKILSSLSEMTPTSSNDMFSDFFGSVSPDEKEEIEKVVDTKIAEEEFEKNAEGYQLVSVDDLIANPLSKFHMREDETWDAIKEMMQKHGFVQGFLITGIPQGDGKVRLVSGHRRTAIAKSLGIKKVPAMLLSVSSEAEEIDLVLAANHSRGDTVTDLLKNYVLCNEKYEKGVWDETETSLYKTKRSFIASKMGCAESRIKNHEFLLNYDPVIWILIDEKVVSVNDIRKLYTANQKGKVKNHDKIIEKLSREKTLLDNSIPLDERRKTAKTILSLANEDGRKNKKRQIEVVLKSVTEVIDKKNYILPKSETKKEELREQIKKLKKDLDVISSSLK